MLAKAWTQVAAEKENPLTSDGWSQQDGAALGDGDEADGAGEPGSSHQVHQRLEEHGTHHAKGQAKEAGVHNEPCVAGGQRAQQVAGAVEGDGEAEEVLDPRPHPPAVGNDAGGRASNHVHNSQDGKQESSWIFINASVLCIGCQENDGGKEAQEHEHVSDQVNQEPSVFKEGEIKVLIDFFKAVLFFFLFYFFLHGAIFSDLSFQSILPFLIHLGFDWCCAWSNGSEESSCHTAV